MRFLCLLLAGLFIFIIAQGQVRISGQIADENGKPLPAASIFLAGTSFGTLSSDSGKFVLASIPSGRYDLIVSFSGFRTFSQSLDGRNLPNIVLPVIKLEPALQELENVIVSPYEKTDWATWGKFFTESFLGTIPEAFQCRIVNDEVLEFRHYRQSGKLRVLAKAPLIIENWALGYTLQYQLELFEYNFKTKVLLYTGYPLFIPKTARNRKQQARWETAREEAFYGSHMHFMRAIYRDKVLEEGFEMRKLVKQPNAEKERVKEVMKLSMTKDPASPNNTGSFSTGKIHPDSMEYYRTVMKQPDNLEILYQPIIRADSIAYQVNPQTAGMFFEQYLHITYLKGIEHKNFPGLNDSGKRPGQPVSQMTLINGKEIEIDQSGAYFAPIDLLLLGYWAWSQKISNMLPFEYKPPPAISK